MNLEKYNHAFLVEVKGLIKDYCEWTFEHGEDGNINCSSCDYIDSSKHFSNEEIIDTNLIRMFIERTIMDSLCITELKSNCLYIRGLEDERAYLGVSTIEDEECNVLTQREYQNTIKQLYSCEYTLSIKINGVPINGEDLREIFYEICAW